MGAQCSGQRRQVGGCVRARRDVKDQFGKFLRDPRHSVGMAQDGRRFHAIEPAIEPVARSDYSDKLSSATASGVRD